LEGAATLYFLSGSRIETIEFWTNGILEIGLVGAATLSFLSGSRIDIIGLNY
jgi:hypothetical protein